MRFRGRPRRYLSEDVADAEGLNSNRGMKVVAGETELRALFPLGCFRGPSLDSIALLAC